MPTNNTENIYSTEFENDPNPIPSTKIGYDNTDSGLTATTVQGAIDEIDEKIDAIVEMPALPSDSADGTYVLKATASSGTITYSWVAEV